jgi:hypothetical protein
MTIMFGVCEDLGNGSDILGNLSPTFGSGLVEKKSSDSGSETKLSKNVLDELTRLGSQLAGLNPREVCIWGNG